MCGYLDHYGLEHEHTDNQIIVRNEGGEPVLTATFDDQKRLTSLEARLEADTDRHAEETTAESSPDEHHSGVSKPPVKSPAGTTPVESWDEGQLRRMMGG